MYTDRFLDHFQNPRNVGELAAPAVTVEVSNPACGDILRLSVRFEQGVATAVRYKVRGCAASIAAGSAATEWMHSKTASEIRALTAQTIEAALGGLPNESRHAAALCVDGARAIAKAQ